VDEGNAPAALPRPGDTIAGKYAIVRVIGEGGMGIVYEANHLRLRRRVALKMLLPHLLATSSDTVARFEREARAAAQLRDRHVTKVLDVDTTAEGLPYLVMEYLEGHDLEAELGARGPLPIGEAVSYMLQVCAAMTEAHDAGIVHRDLKPSNLFLCPDRDGWIVKVLDFGISKMADEGEARLTGTQASVGTPLYMSPEQVRSARNVDARTDIWALGVILYELLAGRTPFEGSTTAAAASIVADPTPPLRYFREDVPLQLHEAIDRALEKDPAARFPTVTEFAQAILPFSGPVHPSVTPPPPPSASALTPEPHSRPVTPSPFHPSHPSHSGRLSYPRAPEGSSTLAHEEVPRMASPTPSVVSARVPPPGAGRALFAVGGVTLLLAGAVGLYAVERVSARHAAASVAPVSVVQPPPASATGAPLPPSESPLRAPLAAAPVVASAASAVVPSAPPASPKVGGGPAARPAPRPQPPAAAAPAAPPTSSAPPPAHGPANPLFL
jgi:serine/threonine protein kinase